MQTYEDLVKLAASLTIVLIGIAVVSVRADDITGTVSKAEPPTKQDGTPAHPYADASQCPPSTDVVIWPSGRTIPSIPLGISFCVVGNQSFNDSDPNVQVRDR
jgi:hypothetical protein